MNQGLQAQRRDSVWHFDRYRVPAQVKHVDAIDRVVFTVMTNCSRLLR